MQSRASSTVPADIATPDAVRYQGLTIKCNVKFMVPARGEYAIACEYVLKPDYTIPICQGEVMRVKDGIEKLCATMLAVMISR